MKVMMDGVIAIPQEMIDRYGLALRAEVDMEPRDGGILIRKSKRKPGEPNDSPYSIPRGGVIQDLRGDDPYVWGRQEGTEEEVDANKMLVRGQVAVPVELLELYGLKRGDNLECRATEDGLLVWKSENQPDSPVVRAAGIMPRGGIIDQLGGIDAFISAVRGGGPRGL